MLATAQRGSYSYRPARTNTDKKGFKAESEKRGMRVDGGLRAEVGV